MIRRRRQRDLLTDRRVRLRAWRLLRLRLPRLALLAALGPGLISGFADNDAGGITTYSIVGAQFGYDLMWVVLASMIALGITQEMGARLGLATGQGFGGLIGQQYGVERAVFALGVMLLANLGDTVAEFAGIGAALAIFGVPIAISSALAALLVIFLLSRANFRKIQFVFLAVGVATAFAYAISAFLARPDWGQAAFRTVVPHGTLTAAYLIAVMGTVGTTITLWSEAFGWESGLDRTWRQAPAFYGFLAFFIGFAALFILIPGLPLIGVMYLSQVFDGLLLPIILVFVILMSRDRRLLGKLRSGPALLGAGWTITVLISLLSVALVASLILNRG